MSGSQVLIAGAAVVVVAVAFAIAATIAQMPDGASEVLSTDPNGMRRLPPLSPDPEDDAPPEPHLWRRLIVGEDGPLGVSDRVEMVARLEMVGEKWCNDALHAAVNEDTDPQVRAAARDALARMTAKS